MKKIIALLITLVMIACVCFIVTSCGDDTAETTNTEATEATETTATETTTDTSATSETTATETTTGTSATSETTAATETTATTETTTDDETTTVEPNEVPLLVIIASFDADGDGEDDFDPNDKTKLYSDKTAPYYGEQWAATKPEDHYKVIFDTEYEWSLINFYKEMTLGRCYYVPVQFDKEVPGQTIQEGILSIVVKIPHPGASNNAAGTISSILRATDEYIDYSKFDRNGDKKITQLELGIVIFNAGPDHAYTGSYANGGYPKGYFAVHGTSQQNSVTMDGVQLVSGNGKGNVSNMGEYSNPGTKITMGVIAHELAHNLGAEDLYDRNPGYGGSDISGWPQPYYYSLQCLGNNAGSGSKPSYEDPYQRVYLGWADEVVADGDGEYTLYSTCSGKYKVLRINTPDPSEYFLVEVRYREGFETGLLSRGYDGGILVWHIDDAINNRYFRGGNACTSYYCDPGATSPHDPGIVPLFRTGWNTTGTRMSTTNPADACYYLSDDPDTAIFDSYKFHSPTNGTQSLNSYPSNWTGEENYNLHIEVLSEPGQEMKIRVTTTTSELGPAVSASSTERTLNTLTLKGTINNANGKDLSGFGFYISKTDDPLKDGRFVSAILSDDGKSFSATVDGLEQSTRYYFVAVAKNEHGDGQSIVVNATTSAPTIEKKYFLVKMYRNYKGKNSSMTEVKVNFGSTLKYSFPMTSAQKAGYTFVGWYLDEDFTQPYDMNYTQDYYGEIFLYAKWDPIS